jgi:hypothetical protein
MKRGLSLAATIVLIAFSTSLLAQQAQTIKATARVGGPFVSEAGREVIVSEHPITAAERAAYREPPEPRNPYFSEAELKVIKQKAARMPAVTRPHDADNGVAAPRAAGDRDDILLPTPSAFEDFAGASETDSCGGLVPSDMGVAVNIGFVAQITNACLSVTNKTGGARVETTLDSLFNWPAGTFTFDPRILYDFSRGKFVATASTIDSNGVAWTDVAASKTSSPSSGWFAYHLATPSGTTLADYPTLGQNWAGDANEGGIYQCYNQYTSAGFAQVICNLLPKAGIYNGKSISYYTSSGFSVGGTILDTIQPVNVSNYHEKPRTEFAVGAINTNGGGVCGGSPCSGVVVWSFANALVQTGTPGPVVSGWFTGFGSTSAYNYPADADNASFCTNCIETLDNRISGMVQYSAGRMFPMIDTANGGTSAALGWVIRPFLNDNGGGCTGTFTDACPTISGVTIEQEFCDYCGAGHGGAGWFGDIAATEENNWTMYANYSSGSDSPGTFYTSNRVTWATPFHDSGEFSCQNNASYTQGRWGDYNAAAPDFNSPGNSPAIWGSGMYVMSDSDWGTCIAANKFVKVTDP